MTAREVAEAYGVQLPVRCVCVWPAVDSHDCVKCIRWLGSYEGKKDMETWARAGVVPPAPPAPCEYPRATATTPRGILLQAAKYIEKGWIVHCGPSHGHWSDQGVDDNGMMVHYASPFAAKLTLIGALARANVGAYVTDALEEATRLLWETVGEDPTIWDHRPGRTQGEVVEALRMAAAQFSEESAREATE